MWNFRQINRNFDSFYSQTVLALAVLALIARQSATIQIIFLE